MEVTDTTTARRSLVEGLKRDRTLGEQELAFVFGAKKAKSIKAKPKPKPKPKRVKTDAPRKKTESQTIPPPTPPVPPVVPTRPHTGFAPPPVVRVPLSTRINSNLAAELKRVSLERQLDNLQPSSVQDILEQALEAWLRQQGRR